MKNYAAALTPLQVAEADIGYLISISRKGISFPAFDKLVASIPFSLSEWSKILKVSPRTFQRYKKEKKIIDPIYTERIYQVVRLHQRGLKIFQHADAFNAWLDTTNVALGHIKPKELMDNHFGIELLEDELTRISHGIFA